ncbi:MAG: glycosyltransferase [Candidatus Nanopelagicales bacterium]
MFEVELRPRRLTDLAAVIPADRIERLQADVVPRMQGELDGHQIINVNSTANGGGVAEMLHVLLPLTLGVGIPTRWFVLDGEPEFFAITKRLHHRLHGNQGDDGFLGEVERDVMRRVAEANVGTLLEAVSPGDVVILHDPQTAPLAPILTARGIPVVWRCHVGVDHDNLYTDEAWEFLRPFLYGNVGEYVFTRPSYAPEWVAPDRLRIIKPSIDPLAPKNEELSDADVAGALAGSGILAGDGFQGASFLRSDGTVAPFRMEAEIVREGPPPSPEVPLVIQVSRWDPLKDMAGVMRAFAEFVAPHTDAHLALVGPSTASVTDDPEGQVVLDTIIAEWRELPADVRSRIHLISLPMDDPEENGALVNALQRHAAVVTQKSLAEGFGLTVTEAMFKGRPVVASAVGGISDQIDDHVSGVLVADPRDLEAFGGDLVALLHDPTAAERIGRAARRRVIDVYLPDTSLDLWNEAVLSAIKHAADTTP